MLTVTTPHGPFEVSRFRGEPRLEIRSAMRGLTLRGHTAAVAAHVLMAGPVDPAEVRVDSYVWRGRPSGSGSGATLGALEDADAVALAVQLVTAVRDAVVAEAAPSRVIEMAELAVSAEHSAIRQLVRIQPLCAELAEWTTSHAEGSLTFSVPLSKVACTGALDQHAARLAARLAELGVPAQVRAGRHLMSTGLTLPDHPLSITADQFHALRG